MNDIPCVGKKVCPRCQEEQSILAFAAEGKRKGGVQGWCRTCRGIQSKKYIQRPASSIFHDLDISRNY